MERLGPYTIEAELGRGGMGVVYRARDTRDGRVVALKTLRDALGDPELIERFRLEAKVLEGLEHPNLVRVLDYDLSPPGPYAVFEFVPGETLEARVAREGPLPIPDALRILSEVAAGLAAAHDRDLLHRDVKPANVLLGPAGAKLADFGLVKRLDRETLTQSGTTLGTASYLAPEQVGSDKARWGPTTDVYGLAATLHYALTGAPPFAGPSALVTLSRVLDEPPPRPSALRPEVPKWLDAVCTRGMAKSNRVRFPSAIAFRLALREGQPSRSVTAPRLAALLGTLLLGLGLVSLRSGASDPPAPEVVGGELPSGPAPVTTQHAVQERGVSAVARSLQRVAIERANTKDLERTRADLVDRHAVAAYLERATRVLDRTRGGSDALRQRWLNKAWRAVLKAAEKLDRDRYAEVGGDELHAWFTARLDDPDYRPRSERLWDYVLFFGEARATYADRACSARWATVGEELLELDRTLGKVSTFRAVSNVACLHLYKEPADPDRAKALLDRLKQRGDLTRRQQTALDRLEAQFPWVESDEVPR